MAKQLPFVVDVVVDPEQIFAYIGRLLAEDMKSSRRRRSPWGSHPVDMNCKAAGSRAGSRGISFRERLSRNQCQDDSQLPLPSGVPASTGIGTTSLVHSERMPELHNVKSCGEVMKLAAGIV